MWNRNVIETEDNSFQEIWTENETQLDGDAKCQKFETEIGISNNCLWMRYQIVAAFLWRCSFSPL